MYDYTDEIMAIASGDGLHSPVSDTDAAIIVNVGTRDFTFSKDFNNIIGVVGDHNSNVVSFQLPRYIDSHDISECSKHKILWGRVVTANDGSKNIMPVDYSYITDIKVLDDQDKVLLGWLITSDITAEACELAFALSISDYDSDGQLIYKWKTTYGQGLIVSYAPDDDDPVPSIQKSYFTMIDQANGDKYKLYVSDGKLMMEPA